MNSRRPHLIGGDRNQRVLREHQHKQFVERVATGLAQPHDRFNSPIEVGDLLMWHPTIDPVGQVMEIEVLPIKHQRPEESTAVRIILAITAPVTAEVGVPMVYLSKQGHVEPATAPAGDTETPPADPPADPETPDEPPDPAR